jgi:hypothetical protein
MKKQHIFTTAITALLISGSAYAAMSIPGPEKWEHHYDQVLCSDYAQQFKDAEQFRGDAHVGAAAKKAAREGETLCRAGEYAHGDTKLSDALAMLHLTPSAEDTDQVD